MKKTLAVLDKFLDGFYVSNKVNFQNHVTDKLIKWFVFDGFENSQHMFNHNVTGFIPSPVLGKKKRFSDYLRAGRRSRC